MIYPAKQQFLKLSKKGNLIPVYKEILADLETPVSAYLKMDKTKYSFLLESVEGYEKTARFSLLGTKPSLIFQSKGNIVKISKNGKTKSFFVKGNPISELKRIISKYKFVSIKGLPSFCGGFVGYLGYDIVRFFERLPERNPDDLNIADSIFILTDSFIIFDHINHKIKFVSNVFIPEGSSAKIKTNLYNKAKVKINRLDSSLKRPLKIYRDREKTKNIARLKSNFSRKEFIEIVKKAKAYIRCGDIIQAVISQRFKVRINKDPLSIYRRLRSINPSPYMFYLKFDRIVLMGSSPELLVRCENRIVQTRPIAGTRPRGKNEVQDKRLERDLLNDKKERAEHIMLVDLGRNDLGRVCISGSIRVDDFMSIERYSHVMHIVTDVNGRLKKDKDIFDALIACFPAGTVTGAPKVRAMEIIEELENTKRGPYAGAVGYFSFSGNFDTCITIRSILVKDNLAYIQAGAGIVADSIPINEYNETVNKARAQINAIVK